MAAPIQARLDEQTRKALERLVRELGWTPSQVVREGVRLLAACHAGRHSKKIIGAGRFRSGIRDLASNKRHLQDFGK